MNRSSAALLAVTLACIAAAVGVVAHDGLRAPAMADTWPQTTGGFGLAGAVSPAWGFFPVDPRFESFCECELWPVPGGVCYSPWHGATVGDLPPLPRHREP